MAVIPLLANSYLQFLYSPLQAVFAVLNFLPILDRVKYEHHGLIPR
jgi:hypothetical protein